ncbi:MAG: hypothetical protein JRI98_10300 [Deltaproteobacteria bacterium]|nr:hypothetical protein [Deltaproteobacteria bacterium]
MIRLYLGGYANDFLQSFQGVVLGHRKVCEQHGHVIADREAASLSGVHRENRAEALHRVDVRASAHQEPAHRPRRRGNHNVVDRSAQ